MKNLLTLLIFFALLGEGIAQIASDRYLIEFTDKDNAPYLITNPEVFLSQRAIDRRTRYSIPVTEQDFPVNPQYIQQVVALGVKYIQQTKWLNAIVIKTTDVSKLEQILALPFVKKVVKNKELPAKAEESVYEVTTKKAGYNTNSFYDYGQAFSQISMVGGIILHDQGFLGQGMAIAVLDGGFTGANFMTAFDSLRANNQIKGTLNMVGGGTYVYQGTSHGSNVLSILASNLPGVMVGTAPKADYFLLRTEDTNGESLIEEYNWVSGAEYADSAGADIISTSLSYTISSDPLVPLTFMQLDGKTAPITKGAEIASSKGILVIASAGNNGQNQSWLHVGFPADGDSVFAIGAVDAHGIRANFSSPGPTFDDRIKPDIMAMGEGTTLMKPDGTVGAGDGTSFSSPVIAGLTACLWQAHPDLTNMEILSAIRKSSTQYFTSDNLMGYGIPDFSEAIKILGVINKPFNDGYATVFPNPFTDEITVNHLPVAADKVSIIISDLTGNKAIGLENIPLTAQGFSVKKLAFLPDGFYLLKITSPEGIFVKKILKINNQHQY